MCIYLREALDLLPYTGRLFCLSTFQCCLLFASNSGIIEWFITKVYLSLSVRYFSSATFKIPKNPLIFPLKLLLVGRIKQLFLQ